MIEMIEREQAMGYDTIFISASLFNRLFYNIQDYLFLYIPLLTMAWLAVIWQEERLSYCILRP